MLISSSIIYGISITLTVPLSSYQIISGYKQIVRDISRIAGPGITSDGPVFHQGKEAVLLVGHVASVQHQSQTYSVQRETKMSKVV